MSYQKLHQHFEKIGAFSHLLSIAGWDERVNMPPQSYKQRAKSVSQIQLMKHELLISPCMGDWLDKAKNENLNVWQTANLREIEKTWQQAICLTPDLIAAQVKATSKCQQLWPQLRQGNCWKDFAPLLDEVINLSRQEAQMRAEKTGVTPYQALVNLYDPGQSVEETMAIFTELKSFLPKFTQKVLGHQAQQKHIAPRGTFDVFQQKELCLDIMKTLGFDFDKGRLDISHHPFCGGVPSDVRITTRYKEDDFTESVMGVVHETGHALYEQGLPEKWINQPVGTALGMSIHESQSLFFEMQIGRSRAMLKVLSPLFKKHLDHGQLSYDFWSVENMQKIYTRVKPDYIRTSADEVTYPLHVILRFELEQDIIAAKLKTQDIPQAWDEKMKEYLNLDTQGNYKDGCMQDIHWPSGGFGYFPSYTLGAMTAAQCFAALKKEHSTIEKDIERGDLFQVKEWLNKHIWSQASLKNKSNLLKDATGETLNSKFFLEHLKNKYLSS